ncbi:MAG: DUF1214 domain-containing protein [Steroidobacteraceae bacterium]
MTSRLAPWSEYIDLLAPAAGLRDILLDPASEQLCAQLYRQLVMNLSLGYFLYFQSSPEHPDWAPFLNSVFLLQPNPDDTYLLAPVRGDGTYRISGTRGTVKLLTFGTGCNMMGMSAQPGRNFDYFDADDLTLGPNGEIDVVLGAERPAGHRGDWWPLHREAEFILVRQRSYDWGGEADARLAIERLDPQPLKPHQNIDDIDSRLRALLGGFAAQLSRQWLTYQKGARDRGLINRLELTTLGGSIAAQYYWQGIFDVGRGEALILDTELPATRPYWNVQLNDELWNAIEFVYRQSSLNGHQARIDGDGRFRAVVAHEDPGVPNWLDPAGSRQGMLIGRWYGCSSNPIPTITRVPCADLRHHLPADTPQVTPAERAAQLRKRRIGAQLRRRW